MHKNNLKHRSRLISITAILAVLFGGLITQSVRAASTNPTPVCTGTSCSVTFEYTGDYYLWSPPTGARSLSFDLMGAQGGRSGGYGGRVTGNFSSTPTSLYIYVGGAGAQGSGAAGGFNGGGKAGTGRGDEGSGGGATDIRLTTALVDRIVVAAGGGGSGGFSGGTGGHAGGTSGSAGVSGQGQGGSGATSTSGGNGGSPNGGTWGTNGTTGAGGNGGSSSTSGGGGGGGGYFGGGGGGADVDSCCSNAGGGGGGASWAQSSQTSGVAHTAAYRTGNGKATISYLMPPSVLSFASAVSITSSTTIDYSLSFNESVSGLTLADLNTSGSTSTCTLITVSGSGANYTITVSGCSSGILKLNLMANSVTGGATGPIAVVTADEVILDQVAPLVIVSEPGSPTNANNLTFGFEFSEDVTGLTASDFSVSPLTCLIENFVGTGTTYELQVTNCADKDEVKLSLASNSVQDAAGNFGPQDEPNFNMILIDRSAAEPEWSSVPETTQSSPAFVISFAEPVVGLEVGDFSFSGTATQCEYSLIENVEKTEFNLVTTGCSPGTIMFRLAQASYADLLGNLGPTIESVSSETNLQQPIPEILPSPTPTPSNEPTVAPSEEPTANPSPSVPEPKESNPPLQTFPAPSAVPEVISTPAVSEPIELNPTVNRSYALNGDAYEPLKEQEPTSQSPDQWESQIVENNPTDAQFIFRGLDFNSMTFIAVAGLSTILAGIGLVKWAAQIRSRRLVRKFS